MFQISPIYRTHMPKLKLTILAASFFICEAQALPLKPIYEEIRDTNAPDFTAYGIEPQRFRYRGSLDGNNDCSVTQSEVAAVAKGINPRNQIVLDIEFWWTVNGLPSSRCASNLTQEQIEDKYIQVVKWAHEANPDLEVGFYAVPPGRHFPGYGDSASVKAWESRAANMEELGATVDRQYPSLYTLTDNQQEWKNFADAQIKQAAQYGKPVCPLVWPEYHQAAPDSVASTPIPYEFWRAQLTHLLNHEDVECIVIWKLARAWNPNAGWWKATLDVMEEMQSTKSKPGVLQFSSTAYDINESAGSASIVVTRSSGSDGAVSVDYSTGNDTAVGGAATDGADYSFTNGTLNFAAGITTSRFSVPIVDDTDVEAIETLNLALTNPDGGATLGASNTAVLAIADNDLSTSAKACEGFTPTIVGTSKGETINGSPGPDVISALGGNDVIRGNGGADVICGGPGDDQIYGGDDNDNLSGGRGNDRLFGDAGDDYLHGHEDFDSCDGGPHVSRDQASSRCERLINVP
jgi:hypothetical protein